jgi:hypothetical protein
MFISNSLGHKVEGLDFIESNDPDVKCYSGSLKDYFIKRGARLLKDDQVVFFDSGVLVPRDDN